MFSVGDIKFLSFAVQHTANTYPLPRRIIPYMDLTYLLSGQMEYYINDEHVTLSAGDAILFPPGSIRKRLLTDTPVCYASFNIQFNTPFTSPVYGHIKQCVRSNTEYLLELMEKELNTVSSEKSEKCTALFSYLFAQLTETACDRENPRIKSIKQYVINNLSRELTLEEIANSIHLAPNYCSSFFKKETGVALMQFVLQERLAMAKRLIITTDQPLHKISEKCGFEDYNYFSHAFKKHVGMSATQYKNKKLSELLKK